MRANVRRWAALWCLALLLGLGGCASLYNGDYVSVRDHEDTQQTAGADEWYYQVSTYAGMRNALTELVAAGAETGVIRVENYAGSVQDDISRVCLDVTRDSAIGAYAVEYITHSVSSILSYSDVRLNISYRVTQEELAAVQSVPALADLYRLVDGALENHQAHLSVQIATLSVTDRTLKNYVESFYLQNPDKLSLKPSVSVSFYPSEDHVSKIITCDFAYRDSREEEQERLNALHAAADGLEASLNGHGAAESALLCAMTLAEWVTPAGSGSTAYDALVNRRADSQGFAMAYQLLCSRCGVSCQVVEGKLDGSVHFWNMIRLGSYSYHVDAYAGTDGDPAAHFLLPDSELIGSYWWDMDRYPACRGILTAQQVLESCGQLPDPAEEAAVLRGSDGG